MSLSARQAAVEDMRTLRRQILSKVFKNGMTANEAAHALALALGYSYSETTVRRDLIVLGLTPVPAAERQREAMATRHAAVKEGLLAGESVQSLAERLNSTVLTIRNDFQALVDAGELSTDLIARSRVQRRLPMMERDVALLGSEALAAFSALKKAVAAEDSLNSQGACPPLMMSSFQPHSQSPSALFEGGLAPFQDVANRLSYLG